MTPFYHNVQQLSLFPSKICFRCGQEKFLEQFPKAPRSKDGCKTYCTACYNAYMSKWQRENYQRKLEFHHQRGREYRQKNREQKRERDRRQYWLNVEQERQQMREYYVNNVEYFREKNKRWLESHPLQAREKDRRYQARRQNATIDAVDYQRILERDGYWCYICEKAIEPHHCLHFDHVIPLARNGSHSEENIKPTHKECNLRKQSRLLDEMTPFQRRGPS